VLGVHVAHVGATSSSFALALDPMAAALARFTQRAGIKGRVGYVEAHAVGSRIGDELEVLAIERGLPGTSPILIGSVKRLIGHLEAASGMAALQKLLLAAKHDVLPATGAPSDMVPHFRNPKSRVVLMTAAGGWNPDADVALVNAVGQSGVMAFVAVERPTDRGATCGRSDASARSDAATTSEDLGAMVRSILVECLPGFDATTANLSFFELGLDSTKATLAASRIQERLGIPVSAVLLFDKHAFEPLVAELHAQILADPNPLTTGPDHSSLADRVRRLEAILLREPPDR
jgi:hypothetical protein